MTNENRDFIGIFHGLALAIAEVGPVEAVLERIAREARGALGAKGAAVRLLDPGRGELDLRSAVGLSPAYLEKGAVDAARSIADTLQGKTVWIEDAGSDPRVAFPEANRAEGIRSILSVPLALRGEVVGELRLYYREPASPEPGEVRFASLLAEQAALAIENARLIQMLREMRDGAVRRSSERLAAMSYYEPPGGCR